MQLKLVALNYHSLILSKTSPLPVLSSDLSTPSPQVAQGDLCVNFINDREDDSEYGSERGSKDVKEHIFLVEVTMTQPISLEMHLIS